MKKSFVVLLHLGFWGCYNILIMVMLGMYYRESADVDIRIGNAYQILFYFAILPAIITFYGFYFYLFPKYLKQKKYAQSIAWGTLISLVAAVIGYNLLSIFVGEDCLGEESPNAHIEMTIFMAFIAMISGVVALVIKGFISWFEEIKLKEALKEKNHEMEMALVKAQLDPHFLFNTINNIDVLILKDPDTASIYLNKLSDIMRFMLYETKADEIPLSKELEYISKYVELQKIRTSNQHYVNYEVIGKPNGKSMAPMVFIPFIENAFKHTGNKKLENAIDIKINIAPSKTTFNCVNKLGGAQKSLSGSNGLGNELIQKRLNLIYPNRHQLNIDQQQDIYKVALTIQHGEI